MSSRFVPTKRAPNPYPFGTVEWHDYENKGVFGNFDRCDRVQRSGQRRMDSQAGQKAVQAVRGEQMRFRQTQLLPPRVDPIVDTVEVQTLRYAAWRTNPEPFGYGYRQGRMHRPIRAYTMAPPGRRVK